MEFHFIHLIINYLLVNNKNSLGIKIKVEDWKTKNYIQLRSFQKRNWILSSAQSAER